MTCDWDLQTDARLMRRYAAVLGSLAFLFFLRVIGQVLVAVFHVRFLPPMDQWYSGLIPYPALLPIQIVILLVQVKMCCDFSRLSGFFVIPRPRAGRYIQWFSYLYFVSMIVRYIASMMIHPERRWFGGTIPIVFHMVLAAYLFVFSHFHTRPRSPRAEMVPSRTNSHDV